MRLGGERRWGLTCSGRRANIDPCSNPSHGKAENGGMSAMLVDWRLVCITGKRERAGCGSQPSGAYFGNTLITGETCQLFQTVIHWNVGPKQVSEMGRAPPAQVSYLSRRTAVLDTAEHTHLGHNPESRQQVAFQPIRVACS